MPVVIVKNGTKIDGIERLSAELLQVFDQPVGGDPHRQVRHLVGDVTRVTLRLIAFRTGARPGEGKIYD